jgi:hypothetical protein
MEDDDKKSFMELTSEKESKWDNIMRYNDDMKYRVFKYLKK